MYTYPLWCVITIMTASANDMASIDRPSSLNTAEVWRGS